VAAPVGAKLLATKWVQTGGSVATSDYSTRERARERERENAHLFLPPLHKNYPVLKNYHHHQLLDIEMKCFISHSISTPFGSEMRFLQLVLGWQDGVIKD
jgi:hypothetical protein